MTRRLAYRDSVVQAYPDVFTPAALAALAALAPLNGDRRQVMAGRIARRRERAQHGQRIGFLAPDALIPRTGIRVQDARDGNFARQRHSRRPQAAVDPGHRPGHQAARREPGAGLRNVAYALLSGADGWMFDGEDALGQVDTMSLDNQRNLKLAIAGDPLFLAVAEEVAEEMNAVGARLPRPPHRRRLAGAARLHHQDLPPARPAPRRPPRARVRRRRLLRLDRRPRALRRQQPATARAPRALRWSLYLPKIQTAEEAALWDDLLAALEQHLGLPAGAIKAYVLVEQIEACFQLMEIRAALGPPLRRLQHRALGLHQQRRRRHGVGSRTSSTRTSTPSR